MRGVHRAGTRSRRRPPRAPRTASTSSASSTSASQLHLPSPLPLLLISLHLLPSQNRKLTRRSVGVHRSHVSQPEHYVECVQVKVENGGSGEPGPTVQFPGVYKDTNEYANFHIYGGLQEFPFPEPAVWSGGAAVATDVGNDGGSGSADPPAAPPVLEAPPLTTSGSDALVGAYYSLLRYSFIAYGGKSAW